MSSAVYVPFVVSARTIAGDPRVPRRAVAITGLGLAPTPVGLPRIPLFVFDYAQPSPSSRVTEGNVTMSANTPAELLSLLNESINAGDLQAIVACYDPEAVFVLPEDQGGEARGREAIGAAYVQFLATKPTLTLNATVIVEARGVAIVLGDWTLEGTGPDANSASMSGKFRDIVRQQPDGTWLYLIDNPFQPG